jgi:hypothetical protein
MTPKSFLKRKRILIRKTKNHNQPRSTKINQIFPSATNFQLTNPVSRRAQVQEDVLRIREVSVHFVNLEAFARRQARLRQAELEAIKNSKLKAL